MRGSVKDHFGVFRGDSLGVNPVGDKPDVVSTPMVEDDGDRVEDAKKENTSEGKTQTQVSTGTSDSEAESKDSKDGDGGKKTPSERPPVENMEDAEEEASRWADAAHALPLVQQQQPLRPKPQKEQDSKHSPKRPPQTQNQAGLAPRMPSQGASLNAAGLASAMATPQNLLPVAPNIPMGWAALAAFPPGFAAGQIPEAQPPLQTPPPLGPQTLLYTVGFGIDPRQAMHNDWDATEAAVRALRDAMERSTVRLPPSTTGSVHHSPFQIHVKIGVPPRKDVLARMEPMSVDLARIASVLPRSIPILNPQIVVGGLSVAGKDDPDVSICTAVACVTVQTNANAQRHAWERAALAAAMQQQQRTQMQTQAPSEASPWADAESLGGAAAKNNVARVDSMEMLARISEEVRERPFALGALADRLRPDGSQNEAEEHDREESDGNEEHPADSFKKLPGKTAKKNQRQFVQHHYHDHSLDEPSFMEDSPLGSTRGRTVGTAFPVKLHDVLTEIEGDGYAYIMSWLPHGRSFKIHKQQEFLDIILPNYFVMTKKSSFLRQLNLCGFNRLSAGPDKGSYCHELFLRGMPFLCKRMVRMKVNGNGIRAAGNPDMEPDFCKMPPVPREEAVTQDLLRALSGQQNKGRIQEVAMAEERNVIKHALIPPRPVSPKASPSGGTSQVSFPLKLHTMLDKLEAEGNSDVVSWLSHGRAFIVHKPDAFAEGLMPEWFRQTKYSSFQRQLHMCSFQRITAGKDKGAYFNENFLRGKPRLAQQMVRTRVNGKGCQKPGDPSNEPDFYYMKPMDPIKFGAVVLSAEDLVARATSSDEEEERDMDM